MKVHPQALERRPVIEDLLQLVKLVLLDIDLLLKLWTVRGRLDPLQARELLVYNLANFVERLTSDHVVLLNSVLRRLRRVVVGLQQLVRRE